MTTLREICTAFAPEYLERYPHLPTTHRQVSSAIQQCRSGAYGHSLSQCPSCGGQPRVNHACGNRHCYPPHIHYIVPGGGLSKDRTTWLPSRANFCVPVKALSPISRAVFKEDMRQAGLLEDIDPQVWTIPWNVHSQANHHGHSAFTYLAPSVFQVAISNHRIGSLKDRTVSFTYRKVGSARLRTAQLEVMEFLRRFLPHVLPHGFMKVRHFGFLHASCAVPLATIRRLIEQGPPSDAPPRQRTPPPRVARCPTCGASMRLVRRRWTSHSDVVDTGEEAGLHPDELCAIRLAQSTAPVRPPPAMRQHQAIAGTSATAC